MLSAPLPGASQILMSLFKVSPCLKSVRQVFELSNFCRKKALPAVAKLRPAASGSYMAANLRHCSRLGCLSAMRTVSRASRDQEMLQLLVQFHCRSKVCDVLCSDQLSLFFHSLHRLFQCWMSHTCEVSDQVRRSPARTTFLPEPIRYLILRLHQPDTCTRVYLMMTPSEGDSPHVSFGSKLRCVQALPAFKMRPASGKVFMEANSAGVIADWCWKPAN